MGFLEKIFKPKEKQSEQDEQAMLAMSKDRWGIDLNDSKAVREKLIELQNETGEVSDLSNLWQNFKSKKEGELPSEQDIEEAFEGAEAEGLEQKTISEAESEAKNKLDAWSEEAVDGYLRKNLSLDNMPQVKVVKVQMMELVKKELEKTPEEKWQSVFEGLKSELDSLNPEA